MNEVHYKAPARQGLIVLAEARRRVTEEHGPRPAMVSMGASRPSFGAITAAFSISSKMIDQFVASLDSASAGRAWDRLVTAECRKIVEEQHAR